VSRGVTVLADTSAHAALEGRSTNETVVTQTQGVVTHGAVSWSVRIPRTVHDLVNDVIRPTLTRHYA
jgi:hypothetical protein